VKEKAEGATGGKLKRSHEEVVLKIIFGGTLGNAGSGG